MYLSYLSGDPDHPAQGKGPNETWLNRTGKRNFKIVAGKLGVGPLNAPPAAPPSNAGSDIYSETSILQHGDKMFLFAWSNFTPDPKADEAGFFQPIVDVASGTIKAYLKI